MDSLGIGVQILSYTAPVDDVVPADEAVRICREANDILAARVAQHPDRFRAMATLPMADPEAAAAELERTVKELCFVGVLLTGQYKGRFYDEPEFFPIFEKAAELDIPAFLERMDYMLDQEKTGLKKKVSDYYKDNIWYTPSGIMSEMQLDYFLKLVGPEHIIWSEDYPYIQTQPLRFFLEKTDLTPDEKYALARGNAERIYKLK